MYHAQKKGVVISMSKSKILRIALMLLLLLIASYVFLGRPQINSAEANITVAVNSRTIYFPDAKPFILDGRTLVPIRFIAEELGAEVSWDEEQKMATLKKGSDIIVLRIDDNRALINGIEKVFDSKTILKDGRTFVPLRLVAESFGARIEWIDDERRVVITAGQMYKLEGTVFLDGNVSRTLDEGERKLESIKLRIKDVSGHTISKTTTNNEGHFEFHLLPGKEYKLSIDTAEAPIKDLNYFSKEPDASSVMDVACISEALTVKMSGNTVKDLGLMQGWLTNPFHKEANAIFHNPVDLDHRLGFYRDFSNMVLEGHDRIWRNTRNPWGYDNHQGVDWDASEGTPILSMAPGVVVADEIFLGGSISLSILYEVGDRAFIISYGHNSKNNVQVGERVSRGQVIAFVGHTGSPARWNHLHLSFWEIPPEFAGRSMREIRMGFLNRYYPSITSTGGGPMGVVLDPFRDVRDPESENFWTIDNKPQFLNARDNVNYEYLYDGVLVRGVDLATAISQQHSHLLANDDQVQQYLRNKPVIGMRRYLKR